MHELLVCVFLLYVVVYIPSVTIGCLHWNQCVNTMQYRSSFLPLWGWSTHWRNSIPNGHSQWAFGMILLPYLVKIAIYGTMHHVRCLATWRRNARHVLRHAHYISSLPDYLLFYLSMGRGRNRFLNLCARVWYFLHSGT